MPKRSMLCVICRRDCGWLSPPGVPRVKANPPSERRAIIGESVWYGRFSGATRGFCIGHVGPEAAVGGPIGLLRNGDTISIDAVAGTIEVDLSDEELEARRADWKPQPHNYNAGAIWRYAQTVGSAEQGAVCHPGAKGETHVYADI